GYHLADNQSKDVTVTLTGDPDNPYSIDTSKVQLTGDPVDGKSLSVATSEGSTIPLDVQPGKVGDTQTFTITQDMLPTGYHLADNQSKDVTVTLTGDPDNPYSIDTSKVQLTGDPVDGKKLSVSTSQGSTIPLDVQPGKVGDTQTFTITQDMLPAGYHLADGKSEDQVKVTLTSDPGNPYSIDTSTIELTGDPTNAGKYTVTLPDGSTGSTSYESAHVGDPVTIDAPAIKGYHPNKQKIDGTLDAKGNFVPNNPDDLTYTGNQENNKPVTVSSNLGDLKLTASGKVGDTIPVQVQKKTGYTSDKDTVQATVNPDGTITTTEKVTYTGVTNTVKDATITNPDGTTTTLPVAPGKYGDGTSTVAIKAPNGYIAPTVLVHYNSDGIATYTNATGSPVDITKLAFTGKTLPTNDVNVPSTQGDKSLHIPSGVVGTTSKPITLDPIYGYETPQVQIKYTPEGAVITDLAGNAITDANKVKYNGVLNPATTVNVKTPNGKTIELNIPEGHYGDKPVTITAPAIAGYSAPAVLVTYDKSGMAKIAYAAQPTKEVTPTDTLNYTSEYTGSSNQNEDNNNGEGVIEHKRQTIATYSDKPDVEIYQFGEDKAMTKVGNRMLAHATNWQSDAVITVDGISYYRVATNEWVKLSQAYPYQALNSYIRTYDDSNKLIFKAESELVKNRTLAPSSSWITDRETYVINGTKYFRIATNEFVSADDVYVYSPVNMTVTTHSNSYTPVYTAKGELVSNRTLNSNTDWSVDSVTYINGDKYYRIATNEFVKASDVDVNH
uniref:SLAP domain-containing protein n=1 Tax=Companilactobacillus hulinensis TaxID=2486007 RepID=UPI00177D13E5